MQLPDLAPNFDGILGLSRCIFFNYPPAVKLTHIIHNRACGASSCYIVGLDPLLLVLSGPGSDLSPRLSLITNTPPVTVIWKFDGGSGR